MNPTVEHAYFGPRDVRRSQFKAEDTADILAALPAFGISGLTPRNVEKMMAYAMDADLQPSVTTASIATPIQFLQNWLPGYVNVITAARKIDEIVGIVTAGAWEDEEIVQGILEMLGTSLPYGDYTNVPLSSWNVNFERRTVVRFEEGLRAGVLEEARASRIRVNSAESKRASATEALEIQRNRVGFYGYNGGLGRTYGFLNDPNLPAASAFPDGASASPAWSTKTFLEICLDIRLMISALRAQSQDTIDPETTNITLALATTSVDYLSTTSDFGISVREWLKDAYPRVRVVSAPELDDAVSGDNVAVMFAESVPGNSTDDGRTWAQVVPAKFRLIGVQQLTKAYEEDYSNATAGVLLKRPYAVVRRTGN
jgi:hypothetical protein